MLSHNVLSYDSCIKNAILKPWKKFMFKWQNGLFSPLSKSLTKPREQETMPTYLQIKNAFLQPSLHKQVMGNIRNLMEGYINQNVKNIHIFFQAQKFDQNSFMHVLICIACDKYDIDMT